MSLHCARRPRSHILSEQSPLEDSNIELAHHSIAPLRPGSLYNGVAMHVWSSYSMGSKQPLPNMHLPLGCYNMVWPKPCES